MDQGVSSGTNFLMLALVIRTGSLTQVGAFSLVYSLFFLLLAVSRGLIGEPYTIQFSDFGNASQRRHVLDSATGAAVLAGFAGAVGCLAIAALTKGSLQVALLCLAPILPGLLLQDAWRLIAFAERRPMKALLSDLTVMSAQLGSYVALAMTNRLSMATIILGWGCAAAAAALLGIWQFRAVPRILEAGAWFRRTRRLGPALAADYAVNRGAEQGTLIALSVVSDLAAQGAISAARALFAPLTTVQTGFNAYALPEMARAHQAGNTRRVSRLAWGIGGLMALLMSVVGLALWSLPDDLGRAAFRDNWHPAQAVILPMTAFSVVNALSFGLWLGVRSMGLAMYSLRTRAFGGTLMVLFAGIGVSMSTAFGVWGMVLSVLPQVVMFARVLHRPPDLDGFDAPINQLFDSR